jgi:hypothetical protein
MQERMRPTFEEACILVERTFGVTPSRLIHEEEA